MQWEGTTYGNSLMHRWLIKLLKHIDIRIVYIFTDVFVIPPCLFRPGFKPIYHYFRERWGFGPVQAFLKTYNKSKKYDYILARQGDNILFANPKFDITKEVVAGLNKRYKAKPEVKKAAKDETKK